jgi:hypothetical protein
MIQAIIPEEAINTESRSSRRRLRLYEPEAIIFTAPAQLNPILLLFNRGETLFSFHWGHAAYQENGRNKHRDSNKL